MRPATVLCPHCRQACRVTHVERLAAVHWTKRYYHCPACQHTFSTIEMPYNASLKVVLLRANRRRREAMSTSPI